MIEFAVPNQRLIYICYFIVDKTELNVDIKVFWNSNNFVCKIDLKKPLMIFFLIIKKIIAFLDMYIVHVQCFISIKKWI